MCATRRQWPPRRISSPLADRTLQPRACVYCVPEDHEALPQLWLSDDEVVALVAALIPLGLRRVRLTGGEPTLRPRLPALVARLAALDLDDLSLSTNATRLTTLSHCRCGAPGLQRLNIESLDTLRADRFAAGLPAHGGSLMEVLAGIDVGLRRGLCGAEAQRRRARRHQRRRAPRARALCVVARHRPTRFIELMPMADGAIAMHGRFLAAASIRARLAGAFAWCAHTRRRHGPATASGRRATTCSASGRARRYHRRGHRALLWKPATAFASPLAAACTPASASTTRSPAPHRAANMTIDPLDLRAALNVGTSASAVHACRAARPRPQTRRPPYFHATPLRRWQAVRDAAMIVIGG